MKHKMILNHRNCLILVKLQFSATAFLYERVKVKVGKNSLSILDLNSRSKFVLQMSLCVRSHFLFFQNQEKAKNLIRSFFRNYIPFFQIIFLNSNVFLIRVVFSSLKKTSKKILNVMSLAFGSFGVYETMVENSAGKQESLMNYVGKGSAGKFSESTLSESTVMKLKFFENQVSSRPLCPRKPSYLRLSKATSQETKNRNLIPNPPQGLSWALSVKIHLKA